MNIGIFTNIYLPGVSGVITSIENHRKELENQGHKDFFSAIYSRKLNYNEILGKARIKLNLDFEKYYSSWLHSG